MSNESILDLGSRGPAAGSPPQAAVGLPARSLLRHAMALGSSGSGKTVLCKVLVEEAARNGVPVIAIDPQGDLGSLLLAPGPEEIAEHGLDADAIRRHHAQLDVVIFSPGSTCGVPLCLDPVSSDLASLVGSDRAHAVARVAASLVGLLGYDLDSDDGAGLIAAFDRTLHQMLEQDLPARGLSDLGDALNKARDGGYADLSRFVAPKKIETACQRLARLDVGARRSLFHDGLPVDIDVLLGRRGPVKEGTTRVSVIHLNALHNQEDKEFVVGAIVDRLYAWMLKNPNPDLQALFYIDEVAPFVPPVRKPAGKDALVLLFKQARKYGVGCLMATQNPGDVDYKAMAQFGTWALGRISTRQDLKKVEPTVKSLAPASSDAVVSTLPSLKPGQFQLLSPDHFEEPVPLSVRRLYSRHETLDDTRIEEIADERWRARFGSMDHAEPADEAEETSVRSASTTDEVEPAPTFAGAAKVQKTLYCEPADEAFEEADGPVETAPPVAVLAPPADPEPAPPAPPTPQPAPKPSEAAPSDVAASVLAAHPSLSAKELAAHMGCGEKKARSLLKQLAEEGRARAFKEKNAVRYFSIQAGGRPDLGLPSAVSIVVPSVPDVTIWAAARDQAKTKLLGLLGEDEVVDRVDLIYRLVYRVDFEESVRAPLHRRLLGPEHEHRLGSVYIHPRTLAVLVLTAREGIRFVDAPTELASEVDDLDGVAHFATEAPGRLAMWDADWTGKKSPADVDRAFRSRFKATPSQISPLFVPVYRVLFRAGAGAGYRVLSYDGVVGRVVIWPGDEVG